MSVARWQLLLGVMVAVLAAGCSATPRPEDGASPSVRTAEPSAIASPSAAGPSASPETTDRPGGARRGEVLLSLGDSVTFGIGSADPAREGFPAQVARRLGGLEAVVLAVPGETATGFLERRLDDTERAIASAGDRLSIVTVALGANELLRVRREAACVEQPDGEACAALVEDAIDTAALALDEILDGIERASAAASADPTVLVLAYYNPDVDPVSAARIVGSDGRTGCVAGEERPGLNDRIACAAEERGAVLVDLHAAFLGRETRLTRIEAGDVHPNERGYRVIAREVADAYRRATR